MKTAKLRLINPKPTLISPHIQALRRSGTHTQSLEGGQERGMFRRLLPVRMFNKPRALGFILFHKSEHDSAGFCASLTHRPEEHETPPPPRISDIPAPFPLPPEQRTYTFPFPFHWHVSSLVSPPTSRGAAGCAETHGKLPTGFGGSPDGILPCFPGIPGLPARPGPALSPPSLRGTRW